MNRPSSGQNNRLIKQLAQWFALLGAAISSFFVLAALIYIFVIDIELVKQLVESNPRAVIGLPCAVLTSYCIVLFLEATSGPIELEALGFKFRGASGPIILWIFVFLAVVSGIAILWNS